MRLIVKAGRPGQSRVDHQDWLDARDLDSHLSWWGPRLVLKARIRKKVHPQQASLFGAEPRAGSGGQTRLFAPQRPPGAGWQIIPRGRKGGYRRRKGRGWEYWYPDTGIQAKPMSGDRPMRIGPAHPEDRENALGVLGALLNTLEGEGWKLVTAPPAMGVTDTEILGRIPGGKVAQLLHHNLTMIQAKPKPVVRKEPAPPSEAVTDAMADRKTKGERKRANETALDIVQRAARQGRGLTDEEAVQVAGYTGKGGISGDANQFYTPVAVADAMWDLTKGYLDSDPQRVLEPSCGSGVFLQTAPAGVKVTGVELDPQAAAISEALHGERHAVESKSFEDFTIENMGRPLNFDAVVANPPYCKRTGGVTLHKHEFASADKYFIDTAIDHLKDGGVGTFLIHPGVLNNKSPGWQEFRRRLLARCEVLDAFRLPNTTFKHVHCGIPADVLVLKKRDKRVGAALAEAARREELDPVLKHFGALDEGLVSGDYFEDRPERIIGQALSADETGWRATVKGDVEDVPDEMRRLTREKKSKPIEGAATEISWEQLGELSQENEALKAAMKRGKMELAAAESPPSLGQTMLVAKSRYLFVGEPPRWQLMESVDDVSQILEKTGDDAIKKAHNLAGEIADLIKLRDEGDYYKSRGARRQVAERVKAWVQEYGVPRSHRALAELAKTAPKLFDFMAAVDSNGELSDILSKDAAITIAPAEVDKSDIMSVADHIARRNRGYVLPKDLQHNWEGWESEDEGELTRKVLASGDYVLDSAARANPEDPPPLQHVEDYLTGNLYDKLEAETERLKEVSGAERAQIERQIKLLRDRLDTKRKSIDDVPIQLRVMGWMPTEWFDAYLNSDEGRETVFGLAPRKKGSPIFRIRREDGMYFLQKVVPPEGMQIRTWKGVEEYEPGEVLDTTIDGSDKFVAHLNTLDFMKYINRLPLKKDRTESVEQDIQEGFSDWIKSSDLRQDLEDRYNQVFNAEFRREYSGDALPLEGIREGIVPHHFQNQAVRWAAETGRGLLGQDVGLGKTFIAILLARIRKQNGVGKRPFCVVPKSVATNWAEEVQTLFPGSRVLVIGEHRKKNRSLERQAKAKAKTMGLSGDALAKYVEENSWGTYSDSDIQRNEKLAAVKQNEYDLIICTKPAFERIPLRKETVEKYEEQDFWYQRADQLERVKGSTKSLDSAQKKIEKLQADWSQEKLKEKFEHPDDLVFWEDMHIDTLIADEAHCFKNLYSARSRDGNKPKFLGGSGQSKQARKMQHMSKWVREENSQNGVYMMTATPTKNSPLEVFNMLQHIAPEAFHELGIENSEQFIDRFCKLEPRMVLTPPGRGGQKRKKKDDDEDETQHRDEFEGAGNLDEALCVTGFTNLKELEVVMDKYMMIQTATDVGLKIPERNNTLHTVDMTQEQRAIYAELRDEAREVNTMEDPGGMFRVLDKMKKAAQDLELLDPEGYKGWHKNSPKYQACAEQAYKGAMERGGQIVFCDHNKAHDRIKAMLIEKGLKEHEIGIINAEVAKDSGARQAIGNRFNRGEIKVVIGNTGTMGEGVNLQGKKHEHGTTDIHHLDQPWDPGTFHQRNGRGVRQGNRAEQVQVHTYLSKGSFDGFRHSTLQGKSRWLDKLRSGADSIENDMEGQSVDEVEMLAMLSENPDEAMKIVAQKRADAKNAWHAKQAQTAISNFFTWQKKHARLRKMQRGTNTAKSLETQLERIQRQLIRNEVLPREIREHLETGDTSPVIPATFVKEAEVEGEGSRIAAKILRPGDVLESNKGSRWAVMALSEDAQKVQIRQWGTSSSRWVDTDSLASGAFPAPELQIKIGSIVRVGGKGKKLVIVSVSQDRGSVLVRELGKKPTKDKSGREKPPPTERVYVEDLTTETFLASDTSEKAELTEILETVMGSRYDDPGQEVGHLSLATLRANSDTVIQAIRDHAEKHERNPILLFRDPEKGIIASSLSESRGHPMVHPWGEDREAIVQALAASQKDNWYFGHTNISAALSMYAPYSSDKSSHVDKIKAEALAIWEAEKKKREKKGRAA